MCVLSMKGEKNPEK